ncbi:MAG: T9SS type A sorting domain-containing protein, partial [Saprospiraceae bacterium]
SANTSAIAPSFHWSGPGGFTSNLSNPTVLQAGLYQLTVTEMFSGCTATAGVLVLQNTLLPAAAAMGGILNCNGSPISLSGSSNTAGVTFSWTGPGFPNPTPAPMVTLPGTYTLLVTAQNGCTSTATAEVVAAQIPDITDVQFSNDLNGQGLGSINLTVSGAPSYTVLWTLNGQYFSDLQNLSNLHAGLYGATVTSIDGCTDTVSVTIDNVVPTIEPVADRLWEIVPNPASTFVNVHFRGEAWPEASLTLLDMAGHKILTAGIINSKSVQLPLKNLPAGQYQLLIRNQGQTVLRPLVIQR